MENKIPAASQLAWDRNEFPNSASQQVAKVSRKSRDLYNPSKGSALSHTMLQLSEGIKLTELLDYTIASYSKADTLINKIRRLYATQNRNESSTAEYT